MIPWELLGSARVPGAGGELRLYRRGGEYAIRIDGRELMTSRAHASEDTLAELACARIASRAGARVLIGGLGMGYTLAAALAWLAADATVHVAEIVPEVAQWNREQLAHLAGHPLDDARVRVAVDDVGNVIGRAQRAYDAILLDVDNGPEALTRAENDALYGSAGLAAAHAALRAGGVLAVWSANRNPAFSARLRGAGFEVEEVSARAHMSRGARHTIWIAQRTRG